MSFYTSLSGGSRSRSGSRGVGASQRALTQAAKQEAAADLRQALFEILNLHRQHFPQSTAPVAPAPPPIDKKAVVRHHENHYLSGIGMFRRAERKDAKSAAAVSAEQDVARLEAERQQQHRDLQQQMDNWWVALLRNDPNVVLSVLADAFADNDAPAAAVGIDGSEVALVLLVPSIEVIPERKPDLTPAGNLTLEKLTKGERGSFHSIAVGSHVLLTVKEALAVAPALTGCRVIAIQHTGDNAYGRPMIDVLMAATFERTQLTHIRWADADALQIIDDASTELIIKLRKVTNQFLPIDLTHEREIKGMIAQLEVDDLVSRK